MPLSVENAPTQSLEARESTVIRGNAKWKTCWRQAAYMAMHIYSDPPPPGGFRTAWPEKKAEIDRHWGVWDELDAQSDYGLVARLFKLKRWEPADPQAPPCPPCLVFRGTDFDDMRDLAIAPHIEVFGFDVYDHPLYVDGTIPANQTRDQLEASGFMPVTLYDKSGWVWVEGATRGLSAPFLVGIRLEILGRENGDWFSNIFQGLGQKTEQYEQAKTYGRRCVRDKISRLGDPRLEIAGHSLGGGLAAAVCTVLDQEFPEVYFHAITFNAAGVHQNTVAPASLAGAAIHNFTVKDEILTTLQSFTGKIPVVGSIFRMAEQHIGQRGMPPAIGTLRVVQGRDSPAGHFTGAGNDLPTVFPIENQTVVPAYTGNLRTLRELDDMLSGASSVQDFGERALRWLNENYREQATANLGDQWIITVVELYKEMARLLMEDLQPEIDVATQVMLAAVDYHGMDYVIASYEAEYG